MKTFEIEDGTTIGEEHGWLCIRSGIGWLMWAKKLAELPARGVSLQTVLWEMQNNSLPPNPRPEPAPTPTT